YTDPYFAKGDVQKLSQIPADWCVESGSYTGVSADFGPLQGGEVGRVYIIRRICARHGAPDRAACILASAEKEDFGRHEAGFDPYACDSRGNRTSQAHPEWRVRRRFSPVRSCAGRIHASIAYASARGDV